MVNHIGHISLKLPHENSLIWTENLTGTLGLYAAKYGKRWRPIDNWPCFLIIVTNSIIFWLSEQDCAIHNPNKSYPFVLTTMFDIHADSILIYSFLKYRSLFQFVQTDNTYCVHMVFGNIWARFLSLAQSKLRLCSANHRPGYWSNLTCDWPSTVWAYAE